MHGMPISEIYTCTNNSQYLLKYEWGCRESYRFWEIFKTKIRKKGCRGYVSIHEPAWCAGVIKIKSCINACLLKSMEQHVVINIHMIAEKTSFETKQVLNKVGNMLKISRVLVYKIWRMWKGQKHLLFCRITNSWGSLLL